MYTNDSEISGNVSIGNTSATRSCISKRLKIVDNVSDGDRDHGLMLNYANNSVISGNSVRGRLRRPRDGRRRQRADDAHDRGRAADAPRGG